MGRGALHLERGERTEAARALAEAVAQGRATPPADTGVSVAPESGGGELTPGAEIGARPAAPMGKVRAPIARVATPGRADYLADVDTQLMLQVRNGDREAAGMLIRRNYERVARYIARVVRQQRAVEDLTQEVFAKVLSSAGSYAPAARFSTWIYRVATNAALKFIQSRYERTHEKESESRLESTPVRDEGPDARMNLEELQERVQDAIGQLPPNQKAATILFECEGLSYEQIASVMSVTEDAVRALLARSRATLRETLGGLME